MQALSVPGFVPLGKPSTSLHNMTPFISRSAGQSIRLNQTSALFFRPHKLSLAVHPAKPDPFSSHQLALHSDNDLAQVRVPVP
jgi:hypothetical protein